MMDVYGMFDMNGKLVDYTKHGPTKAYGFYIVRKIPLEEAIQRFLGRWQEPPQIARPSYTEYHSRCAVQQDLWSRYAYGTFDWSQAVVMHDELAVVNSAWERYYAQTT